jgi:soluble lytic murein transglycosylase-like protein
MVPCLAAILCGLALAQEPYPPADSPVPAATEASRPPGVVAATADPASADSICLLIEAAAGQHGLPVTFLTRLIAQESGFRPSVVGPVTRSGARAQGIAQFMPYTARERGLLDPFDPVQALPHAASYLADLRRQFGSLGLAAAAYNAGPGRPRSWRNGPIMEAAIWAENVPFNETRDYVKKVLANAAEYALRMGRGAPALKAVPIALEGLYDADVLSEEGVLAWHSGVEGSAEVKARAKPFVEWLKEADEEEEEE